MKINSEQEMLNLGREFGQKLMLNITNSPLSSAEKEKAPQSATIIELIGYMGAGKTTFVRGLAQGLGLKSPITSPSFQISKSYAINENSSFIHYDFYRLTDPGLMIDDLSENLISPQNIIAIEWSNSVKDFLPKDHIIINIIYNDDNSRTVNIINQK